MNDRDPEGRKKNEESPVTAEAHCFERAPEV